MYRDFNFKHIINIISIKFVSSTKLLIKYVAKFKSNTIKAKSHNFSTPMIFQYSILKHNMIDFKNNLSMFQKLNIEFNNTKVNFIDTILVKTLILINFYSFKSNIEIITKTEENFKLFGKTNTISNFNIVLNAKNNFYSTTNKDSKILFTQSSNTDFIIFNTIKNDSIIEINGKITPSSLTIAKTYNNKLKFSEKSTAVVYRPKTIYDLYSEKIETWYDKTLEEIFYGEVIE